VVAALVARGRHHEIHAHAPARHQEHRTRAEELDVIRMGDDAEGAPDPAVARTGEELFATPHLPAPRPPGEASLVDQSPQLVGGGRLDPMPPPGSLYRPRQGFWLGRPARGLVALPR